MHYISGLCKVTDVWKNTAKKNMAEKTTGKLRWNSEKFK